MAKNQSLIITSNPSNESITKKIPDNKEILQRIESIDYFLKQLEEFIEMNLKSCIILPRTLRLAKELKLQSSEITVLIFLIILLGCRTYHGLYSFLDDEYLRRGYGIQRLCQMSEVDMEWFLNPERLHIKEGIILTEDDGYSLKVPRTIVNLCYGRKVSEDDLMFVAQTCMEVVLLQEIKGQSPDIHEDEVIDDGEDINDEDIDEEDEVIDADEDNINEDDDDDDVDEDEEQQNPLKRPRVDSIIDENEISDTQLIEDLLPTTTTYTSYPSSNQLEYLEDNFQLIGLYIRRNAVKLKDDMKKEGTRLNPWDTSGDVKQSTRELLAKIKIHEMKIEKRLQLTKQGNIYNLIVHLNVTIFV